MKMILIAFFLTALAFAASDDVSVRADQQVVAGNMLKLRGQVHITFSQMSILAEEADFNIATGELEARGNVRSSGEDKPINGFSVVKLNMNTKSKSGIVLSIRSLPQPVL